MEKPLIDGKDLAEAIGVSPSAVSMAASEERPCEGWAVHEWVRRGPEGAARGYAVPRGAREELGLPAAETAAGAPAFGAGEIASLSGSGAEEEEPAEEGFGEEALEEVTQWYLTVLAARVAQRAYEEMGPWLKEAIRARLEAGEGPPASMGRVRPAAGPEEEGESGRKGSPGEEGESPEREEEADDGFRIDILSSFIEAGLEGDSSGGAAPPEGNSGRS